MCRHIFFLQAHHGMRLTYGTTLSVAYWWFGQVWLSVTKELRDITPEVTVGANSVRGAFFGDIKLVSDHDAEGALSKHTLKFIDLHLAAYWNAWFLWEHNSYICVQLDRYHCLIFLIISLLLLYFGSLVDIWHICAEIWTNHWITWQETW